MINLKVEWLFIAVKSVATFPGRPMCPDIQLNTADFLALWRWTLTVDWLAMFTLKLPQAMRSA
jgi:hypothetical protein